MLPMARPPSQRRPQLRRRQRQPGQLWIAKDRIMSLTAPSWSMPLAKESPEPASGQPFLSRATKSIST